MKTPRDCDSRTPVFLSLHSFNPLASESSKGKKEKKQNSRGNPANAEAKIVEAVCGNDAVPKRNSAAVGIAEPTATA